MGGALLSPHLLGSEHFLAIRIADAPSPTKRVRFLPVQYTATTSRLQLTGRSSDVKTQKALKRKQTTPRNSLAVPVSSRSQFLKWVERGHPWSPSSSSCVSLYLILTYKKDIYLCRRTRDLSRPVLPPQLKKTIDSTTVEYAASNEQRNLDRRNYL